MLEYLAMVYKDSDYTIVIAIVRWFKRAILVLQSPHWWSYECFCLPVDCHCLSAHFSFCSQYRSQVRPTEMLTTLPWLPLCTDAYVKTPWWWSCKHWDIFFCLLPGHHCSLDSNSMVIMWHVH